MKYYPIFLITILILLYSCTSDASDATNAETKGREVVSSTDTKGNSLVVTPSYIDLGEISNSEKKSVKFAFNIENTDSDNLVINKIAPSCGCISLENHPDTIKPREMITIYGTIDLTRQKNHIRKSIYITYNNDKIKLFKILADIIE